MNIHVEKIVNDKPNLVLLHGWASSSKIWQEWLPQLSEYFSLTLIDLPGLGQSSGNGVDSMESLLNIVLEYIPAKCCLLGWSLGGVVATLLAQKMLVLSDREGDVFRYQLTGLITIASNPCFVVRSDWPAAMSKQLFDNFQINLKNNEQKTLSRFFMLQVQKGTASKDILKKLNLIANQESPDDLHQTLALLKNDTRSVLAALQVPSLHFFGECDQLVPMAVSEALEQLSPLITTRVIDGAGHLPFLSDSTLVTNDVRSFLTNQV